MKTLESLKNSKSMKREKLFISELLKKHRGEQAHQEVTE